MFTELPVSGKSHLLLGGGGDLLHFHVVGKTIDDTPIPLEKNSRPPPPDI